jgi:hypothetical protein
MGFVVNEMTAGEGVGTDLIGRCLRYDARFAPDGAPNQGLDRFCETKRRFKKKFIFLNRRQSSHNREVDKLRRSPNYARPNQCCN